ncbi:MAG: hypothetical protein HY369_03990 [Candidatus Aenigmarchaeota archaeon]|nr:hypothetical protein [Candidatus Aenigmarchaeota archaeon]
MEARSTVFLLLAAALAVALAAPAALAHDAPGIENTLDADISAASVAAVAVAGVLAAIGVVISLAKTQKGPVTSTLLFLLIMVPVVLATGYLVVSTVYLNAVSATGGPVHWHTDFEIWNCGQEVDLVDPTGLENRVGSPVLHEHGDNRIHVEGVVVDLQDVNLHAFIETVGGFEEPGKLTVPTNDGPAFLQDGDLCNGAPGTLQGFVYRVTNPDDTRRSGFLVEQVKLDDLGGYVLSPHGNIPPGDCLIIELDQEKPRTDRICETYRLALERGQVTML